MRHRDDIDRVTLGDPATDARPDDSVTVHLRRAARPGARSRSDARWPRRAAASAAWRASRTSLRRCDPLPDGPVIDPAILATLPDRLREAQETFETTGGLHASGLFDPDGSLRARARGRRPAQRAGQGHRRVRDRRCAATPRHHPPRERPGELRARPEGGHGGHPGAGRGGRPDRPRRGDRGTPGHDPGRASCAASAATSTADPTAWASRHDRGPRRARADPTPGRRRSAPAASPRTCG